MNSKKILNILILIFLLMNIMLFMMNYFLYKDDGQLSTERKARLVEILSTKNIELDTELPTVNKMKTLALAKPLDREIELVDKVFSDKLRSSTYSDGEHRHSDGNETLIFNKMVDKGRFFYSANSPVYRVNRANPKDVVDEFVDDFSVGDEDYTILEEKDLNGQKIYILNEVYEGCNIFCNEIVISINGDGISEARAIRYTPSKFSEQSRDLVPIDEVLYNFMYKNKFEEKVKITDISIGYYVNLDLLGIEKSFVVDPHYLISMDNGAKYYINAYTGKIIN